jgi:hypothetical protein
MAMLEHAWANGADQSARAAVGPRLGFFRRRFGKWVALSQCGFPFSLGPYPTSVARFRAVARRSRYAWKGRLLRTLANIAMTLGWPIGAFSTALEVHARMRKLGQTPNGARILLDMYWLALRHSIPPVEYEIYQFNHAERRKDMYEYVYSNDLVGLVALNAHLGADNRDVQDKDRFADICTKHGFPHVPTLAVFDRGSQTRPAAPFVPDAPVLWVKSLRLWGGIGGAKWIKDAADDYVTHNRRVRADKLADEFRKQDCIVQPFIENHPDVARVSNGMLATLRIVTGMHANGDAEFVTALIALPHGVCDTSITVILCSIEPQTGRIRKAALPGGEPVTHHTDTGVPIIGIPLPFWRESVDLVRRAHAIAFPRFAFLGWDVALTKDGPILLETNSGWGAFFHQMFDGPLGHTAFSRLIGHYV